MSTQQALTEANLPDFLRGIGLFEAFETVRVEKAGDGNINWVRRARSDEDGSPEGKSYIIKQARPALERFPQYQAPTERIVIEQRFYAEARRFDREGICPGVHAFEERDRVLVLEDLGAVPRLDEALAAGPVEPRSLERIAAFLGRLHAGTRDDPSLAPRFENGPMQRLHGDHIFRLPFEPNEFPRPPATDARAREVWARPELGEIAARAYERFLTPEGALVHGDVQAGNVLLAPDGPKLLDAEIAHVGDPAFDAGTFLAHLVLPALARGSAAEARPGVQASWRAYGEAHGSESLAGLNDVARYAGLELLRRTIGAARVPAVEDDRAGLRVLDLAQQWILSPPAREEELLAALAG